MATMGLHLITVMLAVVLAGAVLVLSLPMGERG